LIKSKKECGFIDKEQRRCLRFNNFCKAIAEYLFLFSPKASMAKNDFLYVSFRGLWAVVVLGNVLYVMLRWFANTYSSSNVYRRARGKNVSIWFVWMRVSSLFFGFGLWNFLAEQKGCFYLLTVRKPSVWSTRQLGEVLCVVYVQ